MSFPKYGDGHIEPPPAGIGDLEAFAGLGFDVTVLAAEGLVEPETHFFDQAVGRFFVPGELYESGPVVLILTLGII